MQWTLCGELPSDDLRFEGMLDLASEAVAFRLLLPPPRSGRNGRHADAASTRDEPGDRAPSGATVSRSESSRPVFRKPRRRRRLYRSPSGPMRPAVQPRRHTGRWRRRYMTAMPSCSDKLLAALNQTSAAPNKNQIQPRRTLRPETLYPYSEQVELPPEAAELPDDVWRISAKYLATCICSYCIS